MPAPSFLAYTIKTREGHPYMITASSTNTNYYVPASQKPFPPLDLHSPASPSSSYSSFVPLCTSLMLFYSPEQSASLVECPMDAPTHEALLHLLGLKLELSPWCVKIKVIRDQEYHKCGIIIWFKCHEGWEVWVFQHYDERKSGWECRPDVPFQGHW